MSSTSKVHSAQPYPLPLGSAAIPIACGVEGCNESGSLSASGDDRPGAPTGFVMFWPPSGWSLDAADYSHPDLAFVPKCPAHTAEKNLIHALPLSQGGRDV